MKKALQEEIDKLLVLGIIERKTNTWASPIIPVKKQMHTRSGKHLSDPKAPAQYRLCLDLRHVNASSIPYVTHINTVPDIIDALGSTQPSIFSSLDLKMAFFQQSLSEESRQYCGFLFNGHSYQFRSTPQGLASSPYLFQKLMNTVLEEPLNSGYCHVYLDDILIATTDFDTQLNIVDMVLSALIKANLKLCAKKCIFAQPKINFLGFQLTASGIQLADKHIKALLTFPTPQSRSQLKTYLGLVSYFRMHIPHRGKLIEPFSNLLKKDSEFKWTEDHQTNFNQINNILTSNPVLLYPDFDKLFILITDASSIALGAVLCQFKDKVLHPVGYTGRTTTSVERRYDASNLEALAVIFAVKYFHVYLKSKPFEIWTDHAALLKIFKGNKELSPKLIRYALLLNEYNFRIIHVKGIHNLAADALSRTEHVFDTTSTDEDIIEFPREIGTESLQLPQKKRVSFQSMTPSTSQEQDVNAVTREQAKKLQEQDTTYARDTSQPTLSSPPVDDARTSIAPKHEEKQTQDDTAKPLIHSPFTYQELITAQRNDEYCNDLILFLKDEVLPPTETRRRRVIHRENDYFLKDDI